VTFEGPPLLQRKRSLSLNVMLFQYYAHEIRADCSGSANNELNVVNCVGLMHAYYFKDTNATPVIHPIACHCRSATQQQTEVSQLHCREEMSYAITVRAATENLMLFSLYKIFVGRSCSTHTNHSHDPPLGITVFSPKRWINFLD